MSDAQAHLNRKRDALSDVLVDFREAGGHQYDLMMAIDGLVFAAINVALQNEAARAKRDRPTERGEG